MRMVVSLKTTLVGLLVLSGHLQAAQDYRYIESVWSTSSNASLEFHKCDVVDNGAALDLFFTMKQPFDNMTVRLKYAVQNLFREPELY
jgi:hypothetical protein